MGRGVVPSTHAHSCQGYICITTKCVMATSAAGFPFFFFSGSTCKVCSLAGGLEMEKRRKNEILAV